jgi:ribosomal protein S27E
LKTGETAMEDKTFTLITHDDSGKPVEKTISIKARTSFDRVFDKCPHNQVIIDEELWAVECRDCGEKLDPVHYLLSLAKDEAFEGFRLDTIKREYKRIQNILAIKTRTCCEHCGKMTTINTEADIKKIGLLIRYVDTKKNQELNKKTSRKMCGENDEGIGRYEHEFYLLRETAKNKIYVCKFCGITIAEESDHD